MAVGKNWPWMKNETQFWLRHVPRLDVGSVVLLDLHTFACMLDLTAKSPSFILCSATVQVTPNVILSCS